MGLVSIIKEKNIILLFKSTSLIYPVWFLHYFPDDELWCNYPNYLGDLVCSLIYTRELQNNSVLFLEWIHLYKVITVLNLEHKLHNAKKITQITRLMLSLINFKVHNIILSLLSFSQFTFVSTLSTTAIFILSCISCTSLPLLRVNCRRKYVYLCIACERNLNLITLDSIFPIVLLHAYSL